jgi:hypothetical protein
LYRPKFAVYMEEPTEVATQTDVAATAPGENSGG